MKLRLIIASLSLYVASLALPAIAPSPQSTVPGWLLLLYGPFGLAGLREVRWLVNPIFGIAVVLAFVSRGPSRSEQVLAYGSAALALFSAALALSCFLYPVHWIAGDSGSPSSILAELRSGAYAWICAQIVLLIAALWPTTELRQHSQRAA